MKVLSPLPLHLVALGSGEPQASKKQRAWPHVGQPHIPGPASSRRGVPRWGPEGDRAAEAGESPRVPRGRQATELTPPSRGRELHLPVPNPLNKPCLGPAPVRRDPVQLCLTAELPRGGAGKPDPTPPPGWNPWVPGALGRGRSRPWGTPEARGLSDPYGPPGVTLFRMAGLGHLSTPHPIGRRG